MAHRLTGGPGGVEREERGQGDDESRAMAPAREDLTGGPHRQHDRDDDGERHSGRVPARTEPRAALPPVGAAVLEPLVEERPEPCRPSLEDHDFRVVPEPDAVRPQRTIDLRLPEAVPPELARADQQLPA